MAADTSSLSGDDPGGRGRGRQLAALSVEPMFAKSVAAAAIISGAAITYDMSIHPLARRADLDETGAQPGTDGSLALLAWLAFGVVALAVMVSLTVQVLRNPASHESTGRAAVVDYLKTGGPPQLTT